MSLEPRHAGTEDPQRILDGLDRMLSELSLQANGEVLEALGAGLRKLRGALEQLRPAEPRGDGGETLQPEQVYVLRSLLEDTTAHLAYLDPEMNFVEVNETYAKGSGYTREQLVGRNHFDLFPDAENEAIFRRVVETGQPVEYVAKPFEYPERPELGTTYWDWTLRPEFDADGQVRGLVLSLVDVTGVVRSREAATRLSERLRRLRNMDQAVLSARSAGEIADIGLAYLRELTGCRHCSLALVDLEQQHMEMLSALCDRPDCTNPAWLELLSEGGVRQALQRGDVVKADGASPELHAGLLSEGIRSYAFLPLLARTELIGALVIGWSNPEDPDREHLEIGQDIAAQLAIGIQQAQLYETLGRHVAQRTKALTISRARMDAIFEGAPLGIAVLNEGGTIVRSNAALSRMLGYEAGELAGRAFVRLVAPDDASAFEAGLAELGDRPETQQRQTRRLLRSDRRMLWANLVLTRIATEGTQASQLLVIVDDITEERQAQEQLLQSEKLALTGRLAASIAHEINNPLQSVIGCLSLVEEAAADGDDFGEYLQVARDELRRAAGIVANLRDVHRPSREEDLKPVQVNELLEHVLRLTEKRAADSSVEVFSALADDVPLVVAHADRLQQVFLNLVLNGIDAVTGPGRLEVYTQRTDDPKGVTITFHDTGPGIDPHIQTSLFEPFQSTKPGGLGLGLYISRTIVEHHGGHIEVTGGPGKGTTFTVWLPA